MDRRYFSAKIVDWYLQHKRALPWRQTNEPYKIWLSEIILQQTRVLQGLPYYQRFLDKFPTISALALASEQEVLRLWQGLGYYTRARNLHKCAKKIHGELNGVFPSTFHDLRELPGVGDYTAAAIASFSYRESVAVVDGNVFRVLSRIFGIDAPINTPAGKKVFTDLANDLISSSQPDLHNQAIMEFGATWCTPKNSKCDACIFRKNCIAARGELQSRLPVKLKLRESKKRYLHYLAYKKGKSIMMKKRGAKDIWQGLYDFPVVEMARPLSVNKLFQSLPQLKTVNETDVEVTGLYKHVLTHQVIYCRFVIINANKSRQKAVKEAKFYSLEQVGNLPKPVLISRFLADNALHC